MSQITYPRIFFPLSFFLRISPFLSFHFLFIHSVIYFISNTPPPPWKLAIALQYFRFHAVRGRSEKLLILKIGFRLLWRYLFQIYSFFSIYRYKSESFIIIITPLVFYGKYFTFTGCLSHLPAHTLLCIMLFPQIFCSSPRNNVFYLLYLLFEITACWFLLSVRESIWWFVK